MSESQDQAAILDALMAGELDRGQALAALEAKAKADAEASGIENLEFARIDHARARRRGFPEVIYGPGKTRAQIVAIFGRLVARNPNVLCTRTEQSTAQAVAEDLGLTLAVADGTSDGGGPHELEFESRSGLLSMWRDRGLRYPGTILVVSAGTSDQRVAVEASRCAGIMGNRVETLVDVGVAGIHRLLAERPTLERARVIVCVAGFEAALPSVIAGLVACPVIAVPTSTGYGASFNGLSALLGCLTSCAAGVTTVNIDNGFGAAYAATLMNRLETVEDPADSAGTEGEPG